MKQLLRCTLPALVAVGMLAGLGPAGAALAQDQGAPVAPAFEGDPEWPRVIEDDGITFTVYQPQIDKFDSTVLEARAAVQVEATVDDKKQTTYGVVWIKANTFIDKEAGLVQLDDIQITKVEFPDGGRQGRAVPRGLPPQRGARAHVLARAHRGQPRDRAGRQEGQRRPAQERPAEDLLPHVARDPDHDRRRAGAARRGGLGHEARAQLPQPDPPGRRWLLHADRRPLGHVDHGDRSLAPRGERAAQRAADARRARQGREPVPGGPARGSGRGRHGAAREGKDPRRHRLDRARGAHRHRGRARDEADRGDPDPLRGEHVGRHPARPRRTRATTSP